MPKAKWFITLFLSFILIFGSTAGSMVLADTGSGERNGIKAFHVDGQIGDAVIDSSTHTVTFYYDVKNFEQLAALTTDIKVSNQAVISPASGIVQDFRKPIRYTVTSRDGYSQIWTVIGIAQSHTTVNWNNVYQTIDGFGGSGAFHKAGSVMRLQEPLRSQMLDKVFTQEKGIGISILRSMVGDGGTWGSKEYDGPTDTIEPQPGVFVWDDPNWDLKKESFDKYQIWYMKEAKKRGVNTFLSTAWSPPAWMKDNGSVIGGKLKQSSYQDFATYLAEYVLGYKKYYDIDITHISPANEPTLATSYSSCVWTADELNVFVRDYLYPTFSARGVTAKIVMPEHMNFTESLALSALQDPQTVQYIDVMATHAYGIGSTVPALPVTNQKGKTIWQTEYMNQGTALQSYSNNTITDGLKYANLMGNMFSAPRISAYFWWWPVANNGADGSDLIRLTNTGTPQSSAPTENGMFRIFKRYYAFGNYSRFIKPGYVMIDAVKNPVKDVSVTAYKDPETGNFSIVAINNSSKPQSVVFDLNGFPQGTSKVVPYRTSASENLKKLDRIHVKQGSFVMSLKESSVTTFIPERFELPALEDLKDVFSTWEAEENDGQSAGYSKENSADGALTVTNVTYGSYLRYNNVNFADGSADGNADKRYKLSVNARIASLEGGIIEVRLDDPDNGKVVGTIEVPSLHDPNQWITKSAKMDTNPVDGAYGIHDVYMVFKGGQSGSYFNIDYFSFGDGTVTPGG